MTISQYWAVIPAAGVGLRMNDSTPKQYLSLAGKTVLEWSLAPFLTDDRCRAVVVVIAANDARWPRLSLMHPKLHVTYGGMERAHSVLAGLQALQGVAADAWVLVHDAARPCLHADDIESLLGAASQETVGAILATPLADTLKQADDTQRVARTVPRAGLWRALTPQMFRLDLLQTALQTALASGAAVTDESAAIEAMGLQPRLIAGRSDNLKITVPEDLALAASVLATRLFA